jgi:hypothetical protein
MATIADLIEVPRQPDDLARIATFRQRVEALNDEMDSLEPVLARLCRSGYAPDCGWPEGTLLAAADHTLGAISSLDLSEVLTACGQLADKLGDSP